MFFRRFKKLFPLNWRGCFFGVGPFQCFQLVGFHIRSDFRDVFDLCWYKGSMPTQHIGGKSWPRTRRRQCGSLGPVLFWIGLQTGASSAHFNYWSGFGYMPASRSDLKRPSKAGSCPLCERLWINRSDQKSSVLTEQLHWTVATIHSVRTVSIIQNHHC